MALAAVVIARSGRSARSATSHPSAIDTGMRIASAIAEYESTEGRSVPARGLTCAAPGAPGPGAR